jgi:hypothetical protein
MRHTQWYRGREREPLPTPAVILGAGSAGVGKTTVLKDIVQRVPDLILLQKDVQLEGFMWPNPFERRTPGGDLPPNTRLSFNSDAYRNGLRDQVYASVFAQAYDNAMLGKSCIADANYIGWLKDPLGRISFALSMAHFFQNDALAPGAAEALGRLRMPILFFHAHPDVVKERLLKRMATSKTFYDQDRGKLLDEAGNYDDARWQAQLKKEPTTWFADLDAYADILGIDTTEEYEGEQRTRVREQILDFLYQERTLRDTGILKGESLEATLARFAEP